ncbi:hypothetical protein SUGI_1098050 [Cryptomeria japonica]|nr:hypothetical protein SUGI_1098050 [Cryptomeria japonica]
MERGGEGGKEKEVRDVEPMRESGLGPNATSETLKYIFSLYGELEECKAVIDRDSGRSKGYAFVTYKHMEGLKRALRDPCQRIDSRYHLGMIFHCNWGMEFSTL